MSGREAWLARRAATMASGRIDWSGVAGAVVRPNLARSPLTWRDATRMRIEPNRWKSVPLSTPVIKRLLAEGREMRVEIDGRLRAMERAAHGPESRDRAY